MARSRFGARDHGNDTPMNDVPPGTWRVGDTRFNDDVTSPIIEWVCTVAGTPGTWAPRYGGWGILPPEPNSAMVALVDHDLIVADGVTAYTGPSGGLYGTANDATGKFGYATSTGVLATDIQTAFDRAVLTPFKTLEAVGKAFPRSGNGANLRIFIRPRAAFAAYRNAANTADQTMQPVLGDIDGWASVQSRGLLNLLNTTEEIVTSGYMTTPGTNAGGYNVTAVSTAAGYTQYTTCQLAGGGAPAFTAEASGWSTLLGKRGRWSATTTTVALRNTTFIIAEVLGTTGLVPSNTNGTSPVAADIFYIESPGVVVGDMTHNAGQNGSFALTGFQWTANAGFITNRGQASFFGFVPASTVTSVTFDGRGSGSLTISGFSFHGGPGSPGNRVFIGNAAAVTFQNSVVKNTRISVNAPVGNFTFGSGCTINGGYENLFAVDNRTLTIGQQVNTLAAPLRFTDYTYAFGVTFAQAPLNLSGGGGNIYGVRIDNCSLASPFGLIHFQGTPFAVFTSFNNILFPSGTWNVDGLTGSGNTGYVLATGSFSDDGRDFTVAWGVRTANTIASANPPGGTTPNTPVAFWQSCQTSFVPLQYTNIYLAGCNLVTGTATSATTFRDAARNTFRSEPGIDIGLFRVVRSDPQNTILFYNLNPTAATADTLANCTGITGVSINDGGTAGQEVIIATDGIVPIEFTSIPLWSDVGQSVWLSDAIGANAGKVQTTPGTVPVRIGTLYESYGTTIGRVKLCGFGTLTSTAHVLLDRNDLSIFPSGVNLGALTTGLLKETVTAGVAAFSTGIPGSDYVVSIAGTSPISVTGAAGVRTVSLQASAASVLFGRGAGGGAGGAQEITLGTHLSMTGTVLDTTGVVTSIVPGTNITVSGTTAVTVNAVPAGSSGQVQYNAGSNLLGASANLFWDITNSKLGVGTNTPAGELHVSVTSDTTPGTLPTTWDSRFLAVTRGGTSVAAGIGIHYDSSDYANISAAQPGTTFRRMRINAFSLDVYSNSGGGAVLGLFQDSSSSVGVSNLAGATATLVSASTTGVFGRATAGSDYVVSIAGTSPISVTGAAGVRTVSLQASAASVLFGRGAGGGAGVGQEITLGSSLSMTGTVLNVSVGAGLTQGTGITFVGGTAVTANLSTGIAGGQTAYGGTAASEVLTLKGTTHATPGRIFTLDRVGLTTNALLAFGDSAGATDDSWHLTAHQTPSGATMVTSGALVAQVYAGVAGYGFMLRGSTGTSLMEVQGSDGKVVISNLGGGSDALTYSSTTGLLKRAAIGTGLSFSGGSLSCTVTGAPAGSNTQIQYNNSGAFGASASLTWTSSLFFANPTQSWLKSCSSVCGPYDCGGVGGSDNLQLAAWGPRDGSSSRQTGAIAMAGGADVADGGQLACLAITPFGQTFTRAVSPSGAHWWGTYFGTTTLTSAAGGSGNAFLISDSSTVYIAGPPVLSGANWGTSIAANALYVASGTVKIIDTLDVGGGTLRVETTGTKIGFLGATPAARAATPTTLANVITILQTFGLAT